MMHTTNMNEQDWMDRAGLALRESEQSIDAVTLMRLRAGRARAVAALNTPAHGPAWRWAAPAALAAGLLAWLLVPRVAVVPQELPVNVAGADALEVLTDEMGPEFYENLDLYLWLESADQDSESDSA